MKSPRTIHALLIVLAALSLIAACSDGNDMLNGDQGNVRVVLTADGMSTAAATDGGSLAAPGSAGPTGPSASALDGGDDDDDDGDDDDGDHDGDDVLSRLDQANVTFASLLAKNLEGELIDLAVELPLTVDLIELMEGGTIEFPMGTLPPDTYNQIVVVLTELELVFLNGGAITLTPPPGGWTRVMDVTPFTVVEGEVTTIELRFRLRGAIQQFGDAFGFFPDFDCRKR